MVLGKIFHFHSRLGERFHMVSSQRDSFHTWGQQKPAGARIAALKYGSLHKLRHKISVAE